MAATLFLVLDIECSCWLEMDKNSAISHGEAGIGAASTLFANSSHCRHFGEYSFAVATVMLLMMSASNRGLSLLGLCTKEKTCVIVDSVIGFSWDP